MRVCDFIKYCNEHGATDGYEITVANNIKNTAMIDFSRKSADQLTNRKVEAITMRIPVKGLTLGELRKKAVFESKEYDTINLETTIYVRDFDKLEIDVIAVDKMIFLSRKA